MDMDQAHRMAKLYDASWELVREGTSQAGISYVTRANFIARWGDAAAGQDDETLMHWARNLLRHNARPNV